jgi:hypothetical protein
MSLDVPSRMLIATVTLRPEIKVGWRRLRIVQVCDVADEPPAVD